MIDIKSLSFKYPDSKEYTLKNISLHIDSGEIVVISGKSGSGKTTLLKHLKKELMPKGERSGDLEINCTSLEIGYLFQDPHTQIVEDYVYHEIAFGLENLGIPYLEMRHRVGEIVQYFHLEEIYDKRTSELSGGQKQLVNLASIMVMQPKILLLDEPLAQLDPKSREQFISMLECIHHDFGMTIIMVSHILDEIYDCIDRLILLDKGTLIYNDHPSKINSIDEESKMLLPVHIQLLLKTQQPLDTPFYRISDIIEPLNHHVRDYKESEPIIEIKHLYAGYSDEVLTDLSFNINKQEFYCILGSNGSGKTTLLRCLMNDMKYQGKMSVKGKVAYLPQEPLLLINKDSIQEELKGYDSRKVEVLLNKFELSHLFESHPYTHPYDLSGGQQQLLSLTKLLLNDFDILLLDEPTKGIDPIMKDNLGALLQELVKQGKTIICVSHDLEFCGTYGSYFAMLFHHRMDEFTRKEEFFAHNYFYTTQLSKLTRDKNLVISLKDVIW